MNEMNVKNSTLAPANGGVVQPSQFQEGLILEVDSSLMHKGGIPILKNFSHPHQVQAPSKKFCFVYIKSCVTFGGEGGAIIKSLSLWSIFPLTDVQIFQ